MTMTVPGPGPFAGLPMEPSLTAMANRRLNGHNTVDEWGLDLDAATLATRLARFRWHLSVQGADLLPDGPALCVHNQGPGWREPLVLAGALGRASGRPVRFTGAPHVAPIDPILRRVGAVPGTDADLRSLLRRGHLVGVPLARTWGLAARAGDLALDVAEVAVRVGVPVVPVAVAPRIGPAWRIVVGAPIATRRRGTARLAEDIALLARDQVSELLGAARL